MTLSKQPLVSPIRILRSINRSLYASCACERQIEGLAKTAASEGISRGFVETRIGSVETSTPLHGSIPVDCKNTLYNQREYDSTRVSNDVTASNSANFHSECASKCLDKKCPVSRSVSKICWIGCALSAIQSMPRRGYVETGAINY